MNALLLLATLLSYDPSIGADGVGELSVSARVTDETPVVLLIHGGGWSAMDKKDVAGIADFLVRDCGCAVYNVNYRVDDANIATARITPDGAWHEYRLKLDAAQGWSGGVDELWFKAADINHARVAIDWMRFE